ncbi:MAG: rRNA pseudouridine synthase [Dehalococcoidia bacterium]|nr:rRNA pseudouridine synthase [Dehalococcoidia bacterium]
MKRSEEKPMTLLRVLLSCGAGSRRRVACAIMQGNVRVNGETVEDLLHPVDVEGDTVTIGDEQVKLKAEAPVYLMLNKPAGVISTTRDDRGRETVMDILPSKYRDLRLHPVGRLDRDSTGLLLLTNDGRLTYRLTHPKFNHEKEYLISIEGRLKPKEKEKLRGGILLEDGITSSAVVKEVNASPPFNYSLTIREGRKRQVRRMFDSLGHSVLALKRVRMGTFKIGVLREGQVREISFQEVSSLLDGCCRR